MVKQVVKALAGLLVVAGIAVLIGSVYIVTFVRPRETTHNYVQAAAMTSIATGLALWAIATKGEPRRKRRR